MAILAPSLLSADFSRLGEEMDLLDESLCDYIHLDIMDGHYVPNISFGPGLIKALRPRTKKVFDVHLMITEPERYFQDFDQAGADLITIHTDATIHLHRSLQEIKDLGLKAGVALNPGQSLEEIKYVLEDVDLVLIMSVNPGFGGQSFISSALEKIKDLKALRDQKGLNFLIEVDGGIKLDNAKELLEAGADVLVSGSGVFKEDNPKATIQAFKEL